MRIVKLEVEGFTCYRKLVEVDFSDLELFAITGPTGSGKSSLIDTIIFSLYGKVPRLATEVSQLIAQGLQKANILLEFTIGEQNYRVARSIHVSKGSQAILDRWENERWKGVSSGVRQVNQQILQILGLDYDAFIRCIVLPQGEFHNFLHDAKGRQDILTKLLSLELLGEMQKEATQSYEQTKERIKTIQQRLGDEFSIATTENIQQLQLKYDSSIQEIGGYQLRISMLEKQFDEQKEILELLEKLQHTREEYERMQPKFHSMQEIEQKISFFRQLIPIQPQIERYLTLQQRLGKLQANGHDLQKHGSILQENWERQKEAWKILEGQYTKIPEIEHRIEQIQDAKRFQNEENELQTKKSQFENYIHQQNKRLQELQEKQRYHAQMLENQRNKANEIENKILELEQKCHELQKFQNAEPLLNMLKEGFDECQRRIHICKQAWQIREERTQFLQRLKTDLSQQELHVQCLQKTLSNLGNKTKLEAYWQELETSHQIQERIEFHQKEYEQVRQRYQNEVELQKQIQEKIQVEQNSFQVLQFELQQLQKEILSNETLLKLLAEKLPQYKEICRLREENQLQNISLQNKINSIQNEYQYIVSTLPTYQKERQTLQEQWGNHKKEWLRLYTEDLAGILRENLQINCECPVCSQPVHHIPKPIARIAKSVLPELQHTIDIEQQKIKTLDRSIAEMETQAQNLRSNLENLQHELSKLEEKQKIYQRQYSDIIDVLQPHFADQKYEDSQENLGKKITSQKEHNRQSERKIASIQNSIQTQLGMIEKSKGLQEEYKRSVQSNQIIIQELVKKLPDGIGRNDIDTLRLKTKAQLAQIQEIEEKISKEEKKLQQQYTQVQIANQELLNAESNLKVITEEKEIILANYSKKQESVRNQLGMAVTQIGQAITEGIKQYKLVLSEIEKIHQEKKNCTNIIANLEIVQARQNISIEETQQQAREKTNELQLLIGKLQTIHVRIQEITAGEDIENLLSRTKKEKKYIEEHYRNTKENCFKLEQEYQSWQKEKKSLDELLGITQQEYLNLEKHLQILAQQVKVSTIEQLVSLQSEVEKIFQWEQEIMSIQLQKGELEKTIKLTNQQLAGRKSNREMITNIQKDMEQTKQLLNATIENRGRILQEISHAEKSKLLMGDLEKELNQLQKIEGRQKQLAWDLRANKFPSYVLEQAIATLTEDGSKLLDILSEGRYSFATENREINIIDRWNQDEVRNIKTLSGGETFLASLSLALALSERIYQLGQQSGGSASLESLFLDEGFGTLDEEYLDVVVKALVNLQGTGRMVGIISHLPILNNYLPARLVIHKDREGSSIQKIKN